MGSDSAFATAAVILAVLIVAAFVLVPIVGLFGPPLLIAYAVASGGIHNWRLAREQHEQEQWFEQWLRELARERPPRPKRSAVADLRARLAVSEALVVGTVDPGLPEFRPMDEDEPDGADACPVCAADLVRGLEFCINCQHPIERSWGP